MTRDYQIIIIGAGIIGLSVAYYLKKKGCGRVLLLEKEEAWVTGSSALANGGFRQQFSTPVNIRMSQLSLPVFERFVEEFDTDISFRQCGYLFVTATDGGRESLLKNVELQQQQGVPVQWLEPGDLAGFAPYLQSHDLTGGSFCAKDGFADSYSIGVGFGRAALRLGVEVEFGKTVTAILHPEGKIQGVVTEHGHFRAPVVVNAAGPSAALVAGLAGVHLPAQPVRRMLVMSEPFTRLPENMPMTIDVDTGFFARMESGRVLMGWSDPNEPAGFNLTFDPSIIDVVAEKAVRRIPVLEQVQVNPRRSWAGLYSVTPDHHCILGEAPGLRGFFLANGFSGHGMMHSPAVGMVTADLILEGHTDRVDAQQLRLSRFEEGDLIEEMVVI